MWDHTKTTTERGYGHAWRKVRERILQRDKYLCQVCKKKGKITAAKEVDHIIEKAGGGTDSEDNLQSICVPCHRAKTSGGKPKTARDNSWDRWGGLNPQGE